MINRKNLTSKIVRFPSFRKKRAKTASDQQKPNLKDGDEMLGEEGGGSLVVVVREIETKLHQTKRNKELEEVGEMGREDYQQQGGGKRMSKSSLAVNDRDKTMQFMEDTIGPNNERKLQENGTWKRDERENKGETEAEKEGIGGQKSDSKNNTDETAAAGENVEGGKQLRIRYFQGNEKFDNVKEGEEELEKGQKERQHFQIKDEKEEKETQMTDENGKEQRSLETTEKSLENIHMNGGQKKEEIEKLQMTLRTLEEKLRNSNQERDYYKKHFKGEDGGYHNGNGRGQFTDDFGKELLMANKRKYQLESRTKQLEMELRESQQRSNHLAESVKSLEKLLWLEKERSATLEREREQLRGEVGELRRHGDALKRELAQLSGEEGVGCTHFGGESQQEIASRLRAELEQQCNEMRDLKNKMEWRLGEVTQQYNDTKWRLGEVEATLAHRDWEVEQANNRIKQLETSVAATPTATINDELERLKEELARKTEENIKMEWKFGEMNQWWNDAKWRVGELEAETAHRSHLLDRAHHRIGELERRLENNLSFEDLRREKETLEGRATELTKALDDAKWRNGELEAELRSKDELEEQKRKLEWRLGETTQWWNDAKWRIGELENARNSRGNGTEEKNLAVTLGRLSDLLRDGTLLIRKQSHSDRHKWKLLTIANALDEDDVCLRRCWFEADSEGHQEVFLIGSFANWECALLCEPIPEKPSHRGIWLDLPPGRYEFRFLRDGLWHTESKYGECWSEYGTKNNWINVE